MLGEPSFSNFIIKAVNSLYGTTLVSIPFSTANELSEVSRKRGYLEEAYDDALRFDSPAFAKMLRASTKNLIAFGPNKNVT